MTVGSWLTSGWIDVVSVVGWMALVIAVGVLVWRREGDPDGETPRAGTQAAAGLAGRLIALVALGRSFGRRSRHE